MEHNSDHIVIRNLDYRISFPDQPKTVLINCQGGGNNHATPVYDWIRLHKLNTIAEGTCQSFGFTIFTAGEKRMSYPSTVFMVHGGKCSGDSKKNNKKAMENFEKVFWEPWCARMEAISTKPKAYWKELLKSDEIHHYFSARELKEMGVVTHIIGEDI